MDDDKLIRVLAGDDDAIAERIRELLRTDKRFAEIHEEYHVAAKAFLHWRNRDGARSQNAIQYTEMMTEREQELRQLLKSADPKGN